MIKWSNFKFEFTLEKPFVAELVGIEARRRGISGWLLPHEWAERLRNVRRIRSIAGTLELDGTSISEQRLGEILAKSESNRFTRPSSDSVQSKVLDTSRTFAWLRERFGHSIKQKLAFEEVLELHRLSSPNNDNPQSVSGRLRLHEIAADAPSTNSPHRGAPSGALAGLMEEFVEWLASEELANRIHPVVRALVAHFYLATIRPFSEGNDRVARFVETGLLYQSGFDVHGFEGNHHYFSQNEAEYLRLLQSARSSEPFDLTDFVAFGLRGIRRDLEEINSYIHLKVHGALYQRMLDAARSKRVSERRMLLNDREYSLLSYILKITEPDDLLSIQKLREIKLSELQDDLFTATLFKGKTLRTIQREVRRLEDGGFIRYEKRDSEIFITPDFDAVGKY